MNEDMQAVTGKQSEIFGQEALLIDGKRCNILPQKSPIASYEQKGSLNPPDIVSAKWD